MFIFYEFNTMNMMAVLLSTFISYYFLVKNDSKKQKESVQIDKLISSVLIGLIISLVYAYIISGQEESLLTENYWDSNYLE